MDIRIAGIIVVLCLPFCAAVQQEYKGKMRQVAEEHPEFLQAIIRYSELRERYEAPAGITKPKD